MYLLNQHFKVTQMSKHTAITIVVTYMILLLPPMIQTQRLSKRFIHENIRNDFWFNLRVFINLIFMLPLWYVLLIKDIIKKFKKK